MRPVVLALLVVALTGVAQAASLAGVMPDNVNDMWRASYVATDCTQGNCAPGERVVGPGMWAVNHVPAANNQATISKAAGAGVRHVATALTVCLTTTTSAPTGGQIPWMLRDGATGAGTILWQGSLNLASAVGGGGCHSVTGLNLVGTPNTAMTLEFSAAYGANTIETVSLAGYDTQ